MPESPRWLVKVGREAEGRYILGRLRGEDDGLAEAEFQDIRNIVELERKTSKQSSYIAMFFGIGSGKLHTGRRVQLVIWLQIFQEWYVNIVSSPSHMNSLILENFESIGKKRRRNNFHEAIPDLAQEANIMPKDRYCRYYYLRPHDFQNCWYF